MNYKCFRTFMIVGGSLVILGLVIISLTDYMLISEEENITWNNSTKITITKTHYINPNQYYLQRGTGFGLFMSGIVLILITLLRDSD